MRGLNGFEDIGADQIEQAAINLMLSAELADGRSHFAELESDFRAIVWEHIFGRIERADEENAIEGMDPAAVAAQVNFDVATVLARRGVPTRGAPFRQLQALFRRKGYAGK